MGDPLRGEVPGQRLPIGLVQQVVTTVLQHDCARELEPVGAGAGGHLAGAGARQRAVIEQVEHVEHRVGVFFDQAGGRADRRQILLARAHLRGGPIHRGAGQHGAAVGPDDVGAPRAEPGQQVAVAAAPLDDALQRGRRGDAAVRGQRRLGQREALRRAQRQHDDGLGDVERRRRAGGEAHQVHAAGHDGDELARRVRVPLHVGRAQRHQQAVHQVVRERLQVIHHQRQVRTPGRDARRQIVLEGARIGDLRRNFRLATQRLADLPGEAGEERDLVLRARLPEIDVQRSEAARRAQRLGDVSQQVALLAQRRPQQRDAFVGLQVTQHGLRLRLIVDARPLEG